MEPFAKLFESFPRRLYARWWVGKRPHGQTHQVAKLIAEKIGYPTAPLDPFKDDGLISLSRSQAEHVLAVAGTLSLAYESTAPQKFWIEKTAAALRSLDNGATFLSNGTWEKGHPPSWNSMSSATFDCGLIGFDANSAFVFWAEDED